MPLKVRPLMVRVGRIESLRMETSWV